MYVITAGYVNKMMNHNSRIYYIKSDMLEQKHVNSSISYSFDSQIYLYVAFNNIPPENKLVVWVGNRVESLIY